MRVLQVVSSALLVVMCWQPPQLKIDAGDGTAYRFGLLWQLGYEAHGDSPPTSPT